MSKVNFTETLYHLFAMCVDETQIERLPSPLKDVEVVL